MEGLRFRARLCFQDPISPPHTPPAMKFTSVVLLIVPLKSGEREGALERGNLLPPFGAGAFTEHCEMLSQFLLKLTTWPLKKHSWCPQLIMTWVGVMGNLVKP